jgi:hypothetical protein
MFLLLKKKKRRSSHPTPALLFNGLYHEVEIQLIYLSTAYVVHYLLLSVAIGAHIYQVSLLTSNRSGVVLGLQRSNSTQ